MAIACLRLPDAAESGVRTAGAGPHRAGDLVDAGRAAPHLYPGRLPHTLPIRQFFRSGGAMRRSPRAGVTLIEITIAITLLSLLSLGMAIAIRRSEERRVGKERRS